MVSQWLPASKELLQWPIARAALSAGSDLMLLVLAVPFFNLIASHSRDVPVLYTNETHVLMMSISVKMFETDFRTHRS